jgi:hypothetical protein
MEKQLYRVDVVLYIMAEGESEACAAATKVKFDIFECVSEKVKFIDPAWEDSQPYNGDDNRTCGEILPGKKLLTHPVREDVN